MRIDKADFQTRLEAITLNANEAAMIANAVFPAQNQGPAVQIIDDFDAMEPEDGTIPDNKVPASLLETRAQLTGKQNQKTMSALPATLFYRPWFQKDLTAQHGLEAADWCGDFAARQDTGPACEILVLASAIRQAYPNSNTGELVAQLVLSQARYKPFHDLALPLLNQYWYNV